MDRQRFRQEHIQWLSDAIEDQGSYHVSILWLHFTDFSKFFLILIPFVFMFWSVDQLTSCVQLFATPWTAARQASPSFTISQSLLKLMSIESVMPSNHLILCHPLLLLPSIFQSIRVFSNELALRIRWPKYWSFRFSISPSNEYSGLISFRMDWLDLLADVINCYFLLGFEVI